MNSAIYLSDFFDMTLVASIGPPPTHLWVCRTRPDVGTLLRYRMTLMELELEVLLELRRDPAQGERLQGKIVPQAPARVIGARIVE